VPTRTGKTGWNPATIWGMLRNPAYAGQAAFGKTHVTGAPARMTRPARQRGERSGRAARERVASEQWQRIPVPALVSEEQFALVQDLLQRNKRLSPRNTRRPSLLQGILVCRECGYAYYRSSTRSPNGILREYYRCSGSDSSRRPQGRVCHNPPIRMAEVDELVWTQVLGLLEDPTLIETEIERRLATLRAAHPASQRREGLQRDLARAQSAVRRLIDAYQEQLITLEELRARAPKLRAHEATLRAQLNALEAELHDAETYLKLTETLEGFRTRLAASTENLTVEQRQQIGIGEALITSTVVAAVLATRPDLVRTFNYPEGPTIGRRRQVLGKRGRVWGWVLAAMAVAVALAVFVSPFASSSPDGLETVASDAGFEKAAASPAAWNFSPIADYTFPGIHSATVATAAAGAVGTVALFALILLLGRAIGRRGAGNSSVTPGES